MSDITVSMEKKNEFIQILRGIAIIAVVIIHSYPTGGIFGVILRPFVNFAVAMFLFLSGYLTKTEISDYGKFMVKRLKRVVVPYCIWSVIYMIPYGFKNFFTMFLTGRCCSIYYYIFVYIQFVLITPMISMMIKSKHRWSGWMITPLFMVVFQYIFRLAGFSELSSEFMYLFVAWFTYYYMGMMMGNGMLEFNKSNLWSVAVYSGALILSVAEGFIWYRYGDYEMAVSQLRLSSVATSSLVLLFAGRCIRGNVCKGRGVVSKCLLLLGNVSFGIYLSHMIIIKVAEALPIVEFLVFPINTAVYIAVSVLCVIVGRKVLGKFSWMMGLS